MLGHGRTAGRALGQLPAGRTGQEAGPARPVVETHQGPAPVDGVGVVEHGTGQAHELFGEQAAARVGAAAIHPFHGRPAGPLRRHGKRVQRSAGAHHGRRAGRGDDAGTAGPPAPLGDDVDRAVGRRTLLPIGLVVGVEDEGGRDLGKWGPGRGPASHHNRPTRARGRPIRGGRVPPPHQAPTEALGPADRGNQDEDPSGPGHRLGRLDHREHEVEQIGGRRNPQHGGCSLRYRPGHHAAEDGRRGASVGGRRANPHPGRQTTYGASRRRHAEEERDRAGPTPGRPLGQIHHRMRGAPAGPARQREGFDALGRGDVVIDHPTADAATVQGDTHPGSDHDVVGPALGNGVVEELRERGHVGAYPHEPPAGRGDGDPAQRGDPGIRDPGRNAGRRPVAWLPT